MQVGRVEVDHRRGVARGHHHRRIDIERVACGQRQRRVGIERGAVLIRRIQGADRVTEVRALRRQRERPHAPGVVVELHRRADTDVHVARSGEVAVQVGVARCAEAHLGCGTGSTVSAGDNTVE